MEREGLRHKSGVVGRRTLGCSQKNASSLVLGCNPGCALTAEWSLKCYFWINMCKIMSTSRKSKTKQTV